MLYDMYRVPDSRTSKRHAIIMKHSNNRGRIEIVHDILELCLMPQKKTHVMYRANLSFEQSNHYLGILLARGLLESDLQEHVNDRGHQQYLSTTQKGREVLQSLTNAIEIADSIFATKMTQKMV